MQIIETINQIGDFIKDLESTETIGMDVESTGLDCFSDVLLLVQMELNENIYIFNVPKLGLKNLKYIIGLVAGSGKLCMFHNAKFDIKFIYHNTKELITNVYDTMIAESLLTAGVGEYLYSYEKLVLSYLGIKIDKDVRELFIDAEQITQQMFIYSAIDVKYLNSIRKFQELSIKDEGLGRTLDIEMRLIPVISMMEYSGITLDSEEWLRIAKIAKDESESTRAEVINTFWNKLKEIYKNKNAFEVFNDVAIPVKTKKEAELLSGITDLDSIETYFKDKVNVGSHQQLKNLLNIFGIPAEATSKKVLKNYKNHDIINKILFYKERDKQISTYGESFVNHVNKITGRIHTNYNQTGTTTGRFSSDSPNLQNIPRKNEFRRCFIARPEYKLLTADYNQQEYRLMGAVSGEPRIIESYINGLDLHGNTASLMFNKSIEEILSDERWIAKQVNFAILYGSTEWGLFYNFGIPLEKGREYLARHKEIYPVLYKFIELASKKIWELKYSITPNGRKRYFEDKTIFSNHWEIDNYKREVLREGINVIIQGGCADIIKIAMNMMFYQNPFGDLYRPLLQVHDEVVVEVHDSIVDDAVEFTMDMMLKAEQPFLKEIPAAVDYKVENYWTK